jgi:glycogen operon protein
MRDFWRGEANGGEFARRLTGSSDLYQGDGRRPFASLNFITAHDGFTLRDLVSYNSKHNDANLEGNRDGTDDNRSWNCGVEGETDDPEINALRERQQRNFLATLLLSQGAPMLLGGDELGRTQGGNNNGWCQDSEISVVRLGARRGPRGALHALTRRPRAPAAASIRSSVAEVPHGRRARRRGLPDGRHGSGPTQADDRSGLEDPRGTPWRCSLNGEAIAMPGPRGERIVDDCSMLCFNAQHEDLTFRLPVAAAAPAGPRALHGAPGGPARGLGGGPRETTLALIARLPARAQEDRP